MGTGPVKSPKNGSDSAPRRSRLALASLTFATVCAFGPLSVVLLEAVAPTEWSGTEEDGEPFLHTLLTIAMRVEPIYLLFALPGLGTGIAALWTTRGGRALRRWMAWSGTLLSAGVLCYVGWNIATNLLSDPGTQQEYIAETRRNYLEKEGHGNRGAHFANLAGTLERQWLLMDQRPLEESTVMEMLGPPDLVWEDGNYKSFVYFYDRFAKRDWVLYVDIRQGKLYQMGWNDSSVNDHSKWRKYTPATESDPPVAGEKGM